METIINASNGLSDHLFQSFFNNSPSPAWMADEDGYILFMNTHALKVWDLDHTYINKHATELFPKAIIDRFTAINQSMLTSGNPVSFVAEARRLNGTDGYFMINKVMLSDASGKRIVAGYGFDITEQVNAKKALDQSNERFDIIAKVISDCIWDSDLETGAVYRSEALLTLTGYSKEHIENTLEWWEEKTHPDDRGTSFNKFRKVVQEGGTDCDAEYRFLCADNQYRHFYDRGHIVYRDGKPVRAIGIVHDITGRKTQEEKQLQEKVKRQQEISQAIIAAQDHVSNELSKELHDNVNQILATVSMMLHSVLTNKNACEGDCIRQSHEYVRLAMEEIRKISRSLNTSVIRDVGLVSSVEEIITNLQRNLSIRATLQCPPALEEQLTSAHKLMVFRIIQEQVNNIIKHACATEVAIVVAIAGGQLQLTIKDNGKGFNPRLLKRGVGLANIRNRVEAFNGVFNLTTSPCAGVSLDVIVPL